MSDEIPMHRECLSSAALDGVRIQTFVLMNVLEIDPAISDIIRPHLIDAVGQALVMLDSARNLLPVEATSIHTVGGGIVIP